MPSSLGSSCPWWWRSSWFHRWSDWWCHSPFAPPCFSFLFIGFTAVTSPSPSLSSLGAARLPQNSRSFIPRSKSPRQLSWWALRYRGGPWLSWIWRQTCLSCLHGSGQQSRAEPPLTQHLLTFLLCHRGPPQDMHNYLSTNFSFAIPKGGSTEVVELVWAQVIFNPVLVVRVGASHIGQPSESTVFIILVGLIHKA